MMIGKFKQREFNLKTAINIEVNVNKRRLPESPDTKDALDIRIVSADKIIVVGLPEEFYNHNVSTTNTFFFKKPLN